MKTRLVLKPGQRGTKRLVKRYGDALVCVRFRYDAVLGQRLKTVELVVEKTNWTPPPALHAPDARVAIFIKASDMSLRALAKAAGGKWDPEKKLWFVMYGNVVGTRLQEHIHIDESQTRGVGEQHIPVDE